MEILKLCLILIFSCPAMYFERKAEELKITQDLESAIFHYKISRFFLYMSIVAMLSVGISYLL